MFTVLEPGESKGSSGKETRFGFAQKIIRETWMSTESRSVFRFERINIITKLHAVPRRSMYVEFLLERILDRNMKLYRDERMHYENENAKIVLNPKFSFFGA
jgi:hypothetical protein